MAQILTNAHTRKEVSTIALGNKRADQIVSQGHLEEPFSSETSDSSPPAPPSRRPRKRCSGSEHCSAASLSSKRVCIRRPTGSCQSPLNCPDLLIARPHHRAKASLIRSGPRDSPSGPPNRYYGCYEAVSIPLKLEPFTSIRMIWVTNIQ